MTKQEISIKGQQIEGLLWKVFSCSEKERAIQLSGVVHIPVHPHTLHQPAVTDTCAAHPSWQASARSGPAQRPWPALPNAHSHTSDTEINAFLTSGKSWLMSALAVSNGPLNKPIKRNKSLHYTHVKRVLAEHPSQWHQEMYPRCLVSLVQVTDERRENGNEWWNVFNSLSLGISVRSQEYCTVMK